MRTNLRAKLPSDLAARLESQLGKEEFDAFLSSLEEEPRHGLRCNTGKITISELVKLLPFPVHPVPWAPAGFRFSADERPGILPFYQAGLYYLQEPSAMAPAEMLDVKPGERVLDLCAAPGGKSTQLAAALSGEGLLVANDPNPKRIKSLIWNLEHWGATNAVVLNEEPRRLAAAFPGYFDKILIDAPCSGEGMLRKEPNAIHSWRRYSGQACRIVQDEILDQAALMLRDGGRIVYSTCTFNPMENEEAVAAFLKRQTGFFLLPLPYYNGWKPGDTLMECRQLWPHLVEGEGQFLASFEKSRHNADSRHSADGRQTRARERESPGDAFSAAPSEDLSSRTPGGELEPFLEFIRAHLASPPKANYELYHGHVYQRPAGLPDLAGLKVSRPGWYQGVIRNGRFVPAQPLAMGLEAKQFKRKLDLDPLGELPARYLRGETLMLEGEPGWTLVTMGGFPLGFGRQTGSYLKNDYASGWRKV
ncbi:MAG: RsmB/NOP family class I SAM-dependent RNA methyltransferase [Clostridiales bacterium]|nr:RsmB/NOP family class I SAM-dependent RNA methyltransferase [Clostridiales bacterium]